jgi:hypothetical protein
MNEYTRNEIKDLKHCPRQKEGQKGQKKTKKLAKTTPKPLRYPETAKHIPGKNMKKPHTRLMDSIYHCPVFKTG